MNNVSAMNSEIFGQICDTVWRDRVAIVSGRGSLSGETALVRAVYWRLCKAGGAPSKMIENCDTEHTALIYQREVGSMIARCARPRFDSTPLLNELARRYRDEDGL
jgi:hypothetical protein